MITNLLATLLTVFQTNTVVHWPQKFEWQPIQHPEYLNVTPGMDYRPGPNGLIEPGHTVAISDINADTRSIETTITRQRFLSFEFEEQKFSVTNETTLAHFSVDERRVRTNEWFLLCYTTDQHPPFGTPAIDFKIKGTAIYALCQTNWFEPVATNQLLLADGFISLTNRVTKMRFLVIAQCKTN